MIAIMIIIMIIITRHRSHDLMSHMRTTHKTYLRHCTSASSATYSILAPPGIVIHVCYLTLVICVSIVHVYLGVCDSWSHGSYRAACQPHIIPVLHLESIGDASYLRAPWMPGSVFQVELAGNLTDSKLSISSIAQDEWEKEFMQKQLTYAYDRGRARIRLQACQFVVDRWIVPGRVRTCMWRAVALQESVHTCVARVRSRLGAHARRHAVKPSAYTQRSRRVSRV